MSKKEIQLLFQRAKNFLETAKYRLKKGDWDLTCFLSEQAAQLYVKASILEKGGELPRTHSIRKLIGVFSRLIGEKIQLKRESLLLLENAYLMSRYFETIYEEKEAKLAVKIAEEVISQIERFRNTLGD
ncbi:MAG: HEPN domain-containing protein [Promethearchaeota archaeon]